VEIKAIAREAGHRSKVAVHSTQEGIDPVGSCIGIRGNRIQSIVNELQGEKIDVVAWNNEPKTFIGRALSPSEVVHVELSPEAQTAIVVVPDRQLSLAIGKEGQNARLAARLSGWRLDIKGLTDWEEIKATRELEKKEQHEAAVAVLAEAEAEAPEELEVAEIAVADAITPAEAPPELEPEAAPEVILAATPAPAMEELDEEAMLAALIREEEEKEKAVAAVEEGQGISVEELASFTLDDVIEEDSEEEDTEENEDQEFFSAIPVLTPDAGKIRFAEDIAVEMRGGGRRAGRAARRGANRGGGGRR
jgi:N utilization substance protein A